MKKVKIPGIIEVILYAIPLLIILFIAINGIDNSRENKVGSELFSSFRILDSECGGRYKFVCDSDINKMNISETDKNILKESKYDIFIVIGIIFIYIFSILYIRVFISELKQKVKKGENINIFKSLFSNKIMINICFIFVFIIILLIIKRLILE